MPPAAAFFSWSYAAFAASHFSLATRYCSLYFSFASSPSSFHFVAPSFAMSPCLIPSFSATIVGRTSDMNIRYADGGRFGASGSFSFFSFFALPPDDGAPDGGPASSPPSCDSAEVVGVGVGVGFGDFTVFSFGGFGSFGGSGGFSAS